VIALVTVLRTDTRLDIVADAGLGERLRDHFEHYHIREAVELTDTSALTRTVLVAGPEAGSVLATLLADAVALPGEHLAHAIVELAGCRANVVRTLGQGADGFWIRGEPAAITTISQALAAAGVPQASTAELDAARIAAGYPAASDIPEKTLPQELGRDARAISFTKGCYLGQETVARLDALGHVNRRLAIIGIEADTPPSCPSPIRLGDDVVGMLTSWSHDAGRGRMLGLGIVHTKAIDSSAMTIDGASARVLAVPPARLDLP
jgi:folate-binding protein YgfZ